MPLILFEAGQMTPPVKQALIQRLTDVAVEVTGIPKSLFFVCIHELPDTDIAVGGKTVTELKAALASQPSAEQTPAGLGL